jgi:multicomponent K+:H+ antiporter subunit E
MSRWFPQPLMGLVLLAVWLALNGVSPGQAALGVLLAFGLPLALHRFRGDAPRIRAPLTVIRLGIVVLWDIVLANVEVARRILGPESAIRPGYVWVPLDITAPHGIVALAGIITMTPGTLSCDIHPDRRWLLVHCFHLDDPDATVAAIKARYEAPLREIFRC